MAVIRLTASWAVRLWLGLLAWLGASAVPSDYTPPAPTPSVALVRAPSVALACLPKHSTALTRCPVEAMALVRYEAPVRRVYRDMATTRTAFGLRARRSVRAARGR